MMNDMDRMQLDLADTMVYESIEPLDSKMDLHREEQNEPRVLHVSQIQNIDG